jgi:hypothetical protein
MRLPDSRCWRCWVAQGFINSDALPRSLFEQLQHGNVTFSESLYDVVLGKIRNGFLHQRRVPANGRISCGSANVWALFRRRDFEPILLNRSI